MARKSKTEPEAKTSGEASDTAGIERRHAILKAVDDFRDAFGRWLNDDRSDEIEEDGPLADALEMMVAVCRAGHTPEQCLPLAVAVQRIGVEWEKYNAGEWVEPLRTPMPSFHAAVTAIEEARKEAEPPTKRDRPDVAELIEQKVSMRQIAIMFGYRNPTTKLWTGPFFINGAHSESLIRQEAKEKYSIVPEDWESPADVEKRRRFAEDMEARLTRIDRRANDSRAKAGKKKIRPTEKDVVEYLSEGAYESMCVKRWEITADEVRAIAARHGIELLTPDEDRERPPRPEQPAVQQPENNEPGDADEAPSRDEQAAVMVVELAAQGVEVDVIRSQVQDALDVSLTKPKIASIIREQNVTAANAAGE